MKNKKLEQLKSAQNRRRGAAIEMALVFLVVVVALSTLLVSVAMMQAGKVKRSNENLERYLALEQIGEDFCSLREYYTLPEEYAQEYRIEKSSTTLLVYPYPEEGTPLEETQPLLTVELAVIDGKYTVTKWSYD